MCRLYASRYVTEDAGAETFYSCAFDRPSLTLSCSDGDSGNWSQSTWDENGLPQSSAYDSGSVYRYTTLETGEICRGGG